MKLKILLGCFPILFLSSCATIFGGKHNSLIIGKHAPIECIISLDGKTIGSGPGKYKFKKGEILPGSKLEVTNKDEILFQQKIDLAAHPLYLTGDFLLLGLGLIVDVPTGNIYRPYPRKFFVKNEK